MDDTEPEERRDMVVRRTTKLELGIVAALIANVAFIVTLVVTVRQQLAQGIDAIGELKQEFQAFRAQAPEMAVLKYRVEQLEKGGRR